MPWMECKVMDQKLKFIARLIEGEKMAPLCREFGITRPTGYKIWNRYKKLGEMALVEQKRTPNRYANKLPIEVEALILSLKREYSNWGAPKIREKIIKKYPDVKAILLCKKVKDLKRYGVPTVRRLSNNLFTVNEVVEKPDKPKSEFGILPLYYFKSDVFSSLKKIKPGKGKEFQLTDAIQNMIKEKQKVLAITLNKNEEEVDVGTVESYRNAQEVTFRKA